MKTVLLIFCVFLFCCGDNSEQNSGAEMENTAKESQTMQVGQMTWTAPEGWIKETPQSGMRKDQYSLPKAPGDPEDASVVVFYFQGGGGGVTGNIERWQGQFKQPDGRPTADVTEIEKRELNGLEITRVDMTGTYLFQERPMASATTEKPGFRMLAAIIENHSGPWFVKLTGPEATVEKWEKSFNQFIRSFQEK